jgi:hypothetical protein
MTPEGLQVPIRLFDRVRAMFGVPEMPVIVADRIQRQIDQLPEHLNKVTQPAQEYGPIAPPFPRFFVEASAVATDFPTMTQRGLAIYDLSSNEEWFERLITPEHRREIPAGTRWTLGAWGYKYVTAVRQLGTFQCPIYFHLDSEGYILDDMTKLYMEYLPPSMFATVVIGVPDADQELGVVKLDTPTVPQRLLPTFAPFALKAIAALHRRAPVDLVEPNAQARRQAERHDKIKLHSYYVLQVKPTPEGGPRSFREVGQPAREGTRSHHVRGHFRRYGETGMFGKASLANRTIFIRDHNRGTDEYGAIIKDYEPTEE